MHAVERIAHAVYRLIVPGMQRPVKEQRVGPLRPQDPDGLRLRRAADALKGLPGHGLVKIGCRHIAFLLSL